MVYLDDKLHFERLERVPFWHFDVLLVLEMGAGARCTHHTEQALLERRVLRARERANQVERVVCESAPCRTQRLVPSTRAIWISLSVSREQSAISRFTRCSRGLDMLLSCSDSNLPGSQVEGV